ncbi:MULTISPECIES: YbjQ family protein [unclassified Fibrobacter]|uniref:YbjQ family protein n=1 Tax=unclassified Fibrobacter TaxID=2634177 RepID=UPI0015664B58|nr:MULTISPECIES: YbjQ family protein [unclassified Fibrobacter]
MKLYTTDFISGKEFETLQMVRGSVVFSKNVVRDVFAGLKTIIGGEIAGYTEMLNDARNIAIERMTREAAAVGADAIVNVRFATASVMAGSAEIIAYGTAVKFKN